MDKQKPSSKSSSPALAEKPEAAAPAGRRGFLTAAAAVIIGGIVAVVPFAAGLTVFLDPLWRPTTKGKKIKVTTLGFVPDDGLPHRFPVIADLQDAWNRYPDQPIGSVWLIRQPGQNTVKAFNATCPHAGCSIGFSDSEKCFLCPCHASTFDLAGKKLTEDGASPRDMDSLTCTVSKNGNIVVTFLNFRIATPDKIAKA